MKNPQAIALGAAILAVSTGGFATSQSLPSPAAATPNPKASPLGEDAFVRAVQRSNDNEIAAARYVLKSTKNTSIRDFATRMVQDHASSNVALQTAARNGHVALPQSDRAMAMEPSALSTTLEPALDRAYLQQQIAAHKDALAVVTAYASNGANPSLRAFANTQVPVVQAHLDKVQNDLAALPARPNASTSVAPIPAGGNENAGSQNGGQIAPNPPASPGATGSSSPNPQPSLDAPQTPGPRASASPHA